MEEREEEVLLLIDPKSIPLGVEEGLNKHFNSHEYIANNIKYNVKFIQRESLEGLEKVPEIWIVNPALLSRIKPTKEQLAGVKWIQSVFAGMNILVNYFKGIYEEGEEVPFVMTRLGGAFGKPMAEWTLGQIISHERHFHQYKSYQRNHQWKPVLQYRTMEEITMGIVGYGEIGREIARKAKKGFNMKIFAFKRSIKDEDREDENIDQIFDEVDDLLPHVDYLINVLPSTSLTKDFFNKERIEKLNKERKTVFINIGRGDVISPSSLLYSLDHKFFDHAILDVFDIEPVKEDSWMWDREDIDIIPHVSGVSMPHHIISLFHSNFLLYLLHQPLLYPTLLSNEY